MKNPLADGSIGDLHGQMRDLVRNPFHNHLMRQQYDAAVFSYDTKHRNFIYATGRRCLGNAWAGSFWRGFDGLNEDQWRRDASSRQTPGYACWRAGKDVRAALDARMAELPAARASSMSNTLNFGGGTPKPSKPENLALAESAIETYDAAIEIALQVGNQIDFGNRPGATELAALLTARDTLQREKDAVPAYTGQWEDSDYYADEQEAYNRAVDAYGEIRRKVDAKEERRTKGKTDV
jgi:hypothetical protein